MGLPMISCSYFVRGMTGFPMNILPLNRSLYDQFFLYLVMAYLVFLWPAFPISAFLCLRSYIYTWHKWSSYICSSHHWFSYEQPSYHCVPIFAFLWLRLPISMSSCGKGWLQCWPPLNIHHWKALLESFHMVFFKNYFMDPLKRQIFRDAFAQIFSLILRPCHILSGPQKGKSWYSFW